MTHHVFPLTRPIADTGVLVEFGDAINETVQQLVLNFDAAMQQAHINGLTECVPSATCVLVGYDPLQTTYDKMCALIQPYLHSEQTTAAKTAHWQIPTCYAAGLAPDLDDVARKLNISTQEVIDQHCAGRYKITMYGFAPGYAYMNGVPKTIQLPRKPGPVNNVPAQTVMIAGTQCLITTLNMPTGWWRIGMTGFKPLDMQNDQPFVFNVGDTLEFVSVSEKEFNAHSAMR